jgi:hypothetical protein
VIPVDTVEVVTRSWLSARLLGGDTGHQRAPGDGGSRVVRTLRSPTLVSISENLPAC